MFRSLPYWLVVVLSAAFARAGTEATAGAAALPAPRTQTTSLPAGVLGKDWHLTTYQYANTTPLDVRQFGIILRLEASTQAGGFGGCNTYTTLYQVGPNQTLTFNGIVATRQTCRGDALQWEATYFQALQAVNRYEYNGSQLRLYFSNGTSVLTYELASRAVLPPALLGREWRLSAYQRPGEPAADVGFFGITLLLAANGQAGGFAGCNDYSSLYWAGANQALMFGAPIATEKTCASAVRDREQRYLQRLQDVRQYQLVGNNLQLSLSNGQGTLTFVGAVSGPLPRNGKVGMPTTGGGSAGLCEVLALAALAMLAGLLLKYLRLPARRQP